MIKLLSLTLFLTLLLVATVQASAVDVSSTETTSSYTKTTYSDGSGQITLHDPKIKDSDETWQNYLFKETDTSFIFESQTYGSFALDKSSCSLTIYNNGFATSGNKLFDSFSFVLKEAQNGTDIWTDITPSLPACIFKTKKTDTGVEITGTRDSTKIVNLQHTFQNGTTVQSYRTGGLFEIKISTLDGPLQAQSFYTNHDDIKDNTHKYMATYVLNGSIQEVTVDGTKYTNDFTLSTDNITNHILSLKIANTVIELDNTESESLAWAYKLVNGSIIADFGNVNGPLQTNAKIELDPIFNFKKASVHRVITTSSADANCNAGSTKDQIAILHKEDSATSGNCRYLALELDMTQLAGQDLKSATLSTTVNTATNGINCDINPVTNRPSTTAASTLATDINDGTAYSNNNSWCTSTGQKSIALPAAFINDCEANLANGWCALGITFDSITRDSSDHTVDFSDFEITFSYGTSTLPPEPPSISIQNTLANLKLTITQGSGMDNATQPAETTFLIYRSLINSTLYMNQSLANYGSDIETQQGYSKMGSLGNTLLVHYNETGVSGSNTTYKDFHEEGGGRTDATIHKISTAPTTQDDFSGTDNWLDNDAAVLGVDTTNDILNGTIKDDTTNDATSLDLTTTSNTAWVLRFDVKYTNIVDGSGRRHWIGISNVTSGTGATTAQDFIGIDFAKDGADLVYGSNDVDNAALNSVGRDNQVTFNPVSGTTYYFEVIRSSGTAYTINRYTTSAYTSVADSAAGTAASTTDTLRYLKISNGMAGVAGSNTITFDNVKFYNGVTSVSTGTSTTVKGLFGSSAVNLSTAAVNVTSPDINIEGTNNWTFSTFVNMTNSDPFTIFSFPVTMTRTTYMNLNDNSISLFDTGTSIFNYTISPSMGLNKINHITVTRNPAGNYCVFINGTQQSCATTNSTTLGTALSDKYILNARPGLTGYSSGNLWLDETAFFNKTLQAYQAKQLAQRGFIYNFYDDSTIATNATTYTDGGTSDGDNYCYFVRSQNSAGKSEKSNIVCAELDPTIPQPPINPNAKINGTTGTYQVKTLTIKWTISNATFVTGYRIYNSSNDSSYALLVSGLANGTTFYNHNINEHQKQMYYKIYSEPYTTSPPNPSKASTTVYNKTATFPDAPTSLTITNPASGQLKLAWSAGTSDGNSTRKDCSIQYDNTTAGDVAGWVTLVSNSTISGTCTNRQYTHTGLNGGTSYTYQVREGNSVGFSSYSGNGTGTAATFTDITIRLFAERTGDAMKVTPHITFVAGNTGSGLPTLQSIRFYNASAGTIINQTTLNKQFTSGMAQNFTAMYENMLGLQGSNYRMVIQVTNYSASGTISTTENSTLSNFKGVYSPPYIDAEVTTQGKLNYTHTRNSNQNLLTLVVNRDTSSTLFQIECNIKDEFFETGTWYNYTNVAWFNRSISVDPRMSVVGTCYNDALLFQFVSYNNINGTLAISQYTESLGNFFGVPVIFLIVIFLAAIFTGVKAPVGVVVLGGTIGTMGVMGFWVDSSGNALLTAAAWGFIILLVVLGMFTGKKFSGY